MGTRSGLSIPMRKNLSDMTNLPIGENEKPPEISMADKDQIEKLTRERMSLIKFVSERNKIIELSGAELQKLRVNVQKLQLQNWNLARSNSQMLAELNIKREKVKTLEHELQCRDALLKAKNLEMQEGEDGTLDQADKDKKPRIGNKRRATRSQSLGVSAKCQKVEESLTSLGKEEMKCQTSDYLLKEVEGQDVDKDEIPCVGNKKRATRSHSLGTSTTCQNTEHKDKVGSKRRCLRRQSSRFLSHEKEQAANLSDTHDAKFLETSMRRRSSRVKCQEKEMTVNLIDIDDANFSENQYRYGDPTPTNSSTKGEEKENGCVVQSEGASERSSVGRPVCRAVKKDAKFAENSIPNDDSAHLIQSTKEKEDNGVTNSEGVSQGSSIGRSLSLCKAVKNGAKVSENPIPSDDPTSLIPSTIKEEDNGAKKSEGLSQRSSIGRPLRRAVEKVQSYKEPSRVAKMRRTE